MIYDASTMTPEGADTPTDPSRRTRDARAGAVSGRAGAVSRAVSRWISALLWMALIFYLSSLTGSDVPSGPAPLAHLGVYAVLGGLVAYAALRTNAPAAALLAGVLIASLYGITDEIHQAFVPERTPDVLDWLVDVAGAGLGAGVLVWIASSRFEASGTSDYESR